MNGEGFFYFSHEYISRKQNDINKSLLNIYILAYSQRIFLLL